MPVSPVVTACFYLGLDVGKVWDPAAICVLERRRVFRPGPHSRRRAQASGALLVLADSPQPSADS